MAIFQTVYSGTSCSACSQRELPGVSETGWSKLTWKHTHPFNGPLSGTTRVSRNQKGETNLDFTEARDTEWQWHQLGHMQVCTSLRTDNHASTPPLSFLQAGCPSCRPTNSVKALKALRLTWKRPSNEIKSLTCRLVVRHGCGQWWISASEAAETTGRRAVRLHSRPRRGYSSRRRRTGRTQRSMADSRRTPTGSPHPLLYYKSTATNTLLLSIHLPPS